MENGITTYESIKYPMFFSTGVGTPFSNKKITLVSSGAGRVPSVAGSLPASTLDVHLVSRKLVIDPKLFRMERFGPSPTQWPRRINKRVERNEEEEEIGNVAVADIGRFQPLNLADVLLVSHQLSWPSTPFAAERFSLSECTANVEKSARCGQIRFEMARAGCELILP